MPWVHPSFRPKPNDDRVSHFSIAHRKLSLYFIMGWDMSPKLPLPLRGSGLPTNTQLLSIINSLWQYATSTRTTLNTKHRPTLAPSILRHSCIESKLHQCTHSQTNAFNVLKTKNLFTAHELNWTAHKFWTHDFQREHSQHMNTTSLTAVRVLRTVPLEIKLHRWGNRNMHSTTPVQFTCWEQALTANSSQN